MISEKLKKIREYEEKAAAQIPEADRPVFHFSPRVGWLNDPNGFSFYGGKYHLFYQYHPYSSYWGPMHWGHAVSSDMISWEYLPAAMAPDMEYDKSGCFSGTAITLSDGRQLLMYTGCGDSSEDPLAKGRWLQTLPEDCDPYEFRDPYLWRAADGTYRALVAAGRTGEIGKDGNYLHEKGTQLILFRSDDCFEWEFGKVMFEDHRRIGVMWECPNFFDLDGKHILIASPMDMHAEADEAVGSVRFPQGSNVCCIAGEYDEKTEIFTPDGGYEPVDIGLDFYAPQVMKAPDGRLIMIGWMQDPKYGNFADAGDDLTGPGLQYAVPVEHPDGYIHGPEGTRIFGQMTVPRELKFRDGKLYQWPVRELCEYRKNRLDYDGVLLKDEERRFDGISGRAIELEVEIAPYEVGAPLYREFTIDFAKDEDHFIRLSYKPARSLITIDRSRSGQCSEITARRSYRAKYSYGSLSLRILIDKWSAEVFVNGGEQVMSLTYYTPPEADGISFAAEGSVQMDVTAYQLKD